MQYICNLVTLQRKICQGFLFVFLFLCIFTCVSKFWNKSDTKIFASTQRSCQASFHAKILKIHHSIMGISSLNVKNCFFTSWHCSCDKAANLKLFLSLTEILSNIETWSWIDVFLHHTTQAEFLTKQFTLPQDFGQWELQTRLEYFIKSSSDTWYVLTA